MEKGPQRRERVFLHKERESGLCYPTLHNEKENEAAMIK